MHDGEYKKERRGTELKILCLVFLTLRKVSGTESDDLEIEEPRDVVCKHFALLYFVFHGASAYKRPLCTCPILT